MKVYLKRVFCKRTLPPGSGGTFSCDGCYFLGLPDDRVPCTRPDSVECIVRGRHYIFRRATQGETTAWLANMHMRALREDLDKIRRPCLTWSPRGKVVFCLQQQAQTLADGLSIIQKEISRLKTADSRERAAAKKQTRRKK